MAQPQNEVSGEEEYVVTLAEMMLAIKKQLDRMELRLDILGEAMAKAIQPQWKAIDK